MTDQSINLKLEVIKQARDILLKSAEVANRDAQPLHWIGDAKDQSTEYCYACATEIVEQKAVEAQQDGELFVDGGWRTGNDTTPFCECCGVRLEYSPTDYCTEEEIDHFLGFWNDDIGVDDALDLVDIFGAVIALGDQADLRRWAGTQRADGAAARLDGAFILAERVISAVVFATSRMDPLGAWDGVPSRSHDLVETIAAMKAHSRGIGE